MPALGLPGAVVDGIRQGARSVRGWQVWTLPQSLRVYILSITTFSFIVAAIAASRTRWQLTDVVIFVGLLACGVIAIESTRNVREVQGTVGRDLQTVWYLAIAVTLPPAYAFLAPIPLTAYRLWRVRRVLIYRRVFSNATISLAYGGASVAFHRVPASFAGPIPGSG